ncbi:MAG: hypothetical protein B7733_24985 [Myxococcales bacterium FL481]|nr:MAG: hypothetical protein B7733_24985 [Myxococcales bacterium FL481]
MSARPEAFLDDFVLPLLKGHELAINGRPLSRRDAVVVAKTGALDSTELWLARRDRGRALVAEPELVAPDLEELNLWMGLHNVLLLDHPDRPRVWTRERTWQSVEMETRALLGFPGGDEVGELLARHVAVGRLLDLQREDQVVTSDEGERRYAGQATPRRALAAGPSIAWRTETVRWLDQAHDAAVSRLLPEAFRASPLTCLLCPEVAPREWSPLHAANVFDHRHYARAVCHYWARRPTWVITGGIIVGSLLKALGVADDDESDAVGSIAPRIGTGSQLAALPGRSFPAGPRQVGAIVGALIHVHLLKVLELDARVIAASGTGDHTILTFLALPLLLPTLEPALGHPFAGLAGRAQQTLRRHWDEYCEHLVGIVPRSVRENLLVTLVPRIVEKASA